MSSLSDAALVNVIRRYALPATKKAFLGVFPIDNLPHRIPQYPAIMIVNTQSHNLPGEHWLSVYISGNRHGEVFDSLGLSLSKRLTHWLNQFTKKWRTSTKVYQNPFSDKCGGYALYYVLNRIQNCKLHLTPSPAINDEIVMTFYNTVIGK